jgi:hypothetical protein
MRFRYGLVLVALLGAGRAEGQSIVCPPVEFSTEVDPRAITLHWQDPPESLQTTATLSLKKIRAIACGPDSICTSEDSLSWRGTSLPTIAGRYTGRCDVTFTFRYNGLPARFTTVDSARVDPGWTGSSLPVSGGAYPSCSDTALFRLHVTAGGDIGGAAGLEVAWQDTAGGSGVVVIPPGYTPGTFLDMSKGVRVAFTAGSLVAGEAFAIRTRVPEPVVLRYVRPISQTLDELFTVTLCRPDTAVTLEDGLTLTLSPGMLLPNSEDLGDSVGTFRVRAERFDGFRVYRSDIRGLGEFTLLREFNSCRAADSVFFVTSDHEYRDIEVHNGFPYRYAVTCYDTLSAAESPRSPTVALYPRSDPASASNEIRVVPNPYKRRAAWEEGGESKIQFINVPLSATIRIYTVSGSLVREIRPEDVSRGCGALPLPGCVNWDLRNGQGEEIVSGIYIYQAETPGSDSFVGKFMVAR